MGSFTNHRLIEKNIFYVLPSRSLPRKDLFYKDIPRMHISVGAVPCLSPAGKVLINEISKEVMEETQLLIVVRRYLISFSKNITFPFQNNNTMKILLNYF